MRIVGSWNEMDRRCQSEKAGPGRLANFCCVDRSVD
jgi:hypothetical protein